MYIYIIHIKYNIYIYILYILYNVYIERSKNACAVQKMLYAMHMPIIQNSAMLNFNNANKNSLTYIFENS